MTDYFCRSVRRQAEAGPPVILYSHPQHFGLLAEETFPQLAEASVLCRSGMRRWASWTHGAEARRCGLRCFWEDSLTVTGDLPEDVSIRVIEPKGE